MDGTWLEYGIKGFLFCSGFAIAAIIALLIVYFVAGFAKGIAGIFRQDDDDDEAEDVGNDNDGER